MSTKKPRGVRDRAFLAQIGAKGGKTTLARHGSAHFQTLGAKGGNALLAARGRSYYSRIAQEGHARRAARQAAKKYESA